MFERPHHRRILRVLQALDANRLKEAACWFGGGTAIALRYGEYRESVDIGFLVSSRDGYRALRQLPWGARDLAPLFRAGESPDTRGEVRADQYGIRATLDIDGIPIKFEIVLEGRIQFEKPGRKDEIAGVATLSETDLAASKLLANSDRWADDSVFSRDAIDLAMMALPPRLLRPAVTKAEGAYGAAVIHDLRSALDALRDRPAHLRRCLEALAMDIPPATLLQRLRHLRRRLDAAASP